MFYFTALFTLILLGKCAESYRASVYEHVPSIKDTPEETIKNNLEWYRKHVSQARDSTNGFDIVVFPEYGLTGLDPSPLDEYAISIEDNTYNIIREFKDMASEYTVYIVVNFLEKEVKSNAKTKYYNTNLVFSNNGTIVAKYRKINLFNEDKLTRGEDIATFTTDFGVTFGVFTSFDIFFHKPSREILADSRVTDVVYPTAWKSAMPFYTSLSVQYGYAVANGINLLSASYNTPKKGYGGSSIISSEGKVRDSYIGFSTSSKPIVQSVPKITMRQDVTECSNFAPQALPGGTTDKPTVSDFVTDRLFNSAEYQFENLDLTQTDTFKQVCDEDFCCNFNITISEANTNEVYKLVAFDGEESLGGVKRHIRVCSLLACNSDNRDSCGARINGTTKFRIRVEGTLKKTNMTHYTPITLTYDLKPIEASSYCEKSNDNSANVQFFTQKVQGNVLVFGIYGFENTSSAFSVKSSAMFLLMLAVVKYVF